MLLKLEPALLIYEFIQVSVKTEIVYSQDCLLSPEFGWCNTNIKYVFTLFFMSENKKVISDS